MIKFWETAHKRYVPLGGTGPTARRQRKDSPPAWLQGAILVLGDLMYSGCWKINLGW